jgi:hypothetical protein
MLGAPMKRFPVAVPVLALALAAAPAIAQVTVARAGSEINVSIGGKPYTTLFMGPDAPKPYLHPLRAASGRIVTRLYPMEVAPGESRDHPHHRGLWFAHGDVNGYDFWTNEESEKGPNKGRIVLDRVLRLTSGDESGSIAALFRWLDTQGRPLLTESRHMTFYAEPGGRTIDVDIDLTAIGKVTFGDSKEGTFAIRVAPWLEEPGAGQPEEPKRTGLIVNAEGARGERNVWGKRSDWVDYSGEVEGEKLGIAILDHPSNPRHPTYWHARGYGMFAVNIFGLKEFEHDPTKDGSLTLADGEHLRFRYRVIIHSGDSQSAHIAARYAEYAAVK